MPFEITLPVRPKILVITLRRLGDVLLTTPLIRSLRRARPDATVDVLVFKGTAGILGGNPDISNVVTMSERPTLAETLQLLSRLTKRYDLAVSTQSGDRPTFYALVAGRMHAGITADVTFSDQIKARILHRGVQANERIHRVEQTLRLADAIGIPRVPELVCPAAAPRAIADGDYAVVHASPMFAYKEWTRDGWRALAAHLATRGLAVTAIGGPDEAERKYCDDVWRGITPVHQFEWAELTTLLKGARLYIGPDTSVTHLAAAAGCRTVAIFGPTDPRLWGPWPVGGLPTPWDASGSIQNRGNVWLVQNPLPCMPCQLEGCERNIMSRSVCLDELSPKIVLRAVDQALA